MEELMYVMPNPEAVKLLPPKIREAMEQFTSLPPDRFELIGDSSHFNHALDRAWTRLKSQ